jgi:hypothetical protein
MENVHEWGKKKISNCRVCNQRHKNHGIGFNEIFCVNIYYIENISNRIPIASLIYVNIPIACTKTLKHIKLSYNKIKS